jgi:hypothetical protein
LKSKKYHTSGTVPKYKSKIDTLAQTQDLPISWLAIGTSIQIKMRR